MTKFEIGKKYSISSICNHETTWDYEVVSRTDHTITIKDLFDGKIKKCRISKGLSEYEGYECVYPLGKYSMCPILRAKSL